MVVRLVLRDSLEVKKLKQVVAVSSSGNESERLLLTRVSVWACILYLRTLDDPYHRGPHTYVFKEYIYF